MNDYKAYLDYLRIHTKPTGIHFWTYCLEESFAFGFVEAYHR